MDDAGAQRKQAGETSSIVRSLWDPFGLMQGMFGWGRPADGPLFEVEETDDTFVCKVKIQLTLPDQADLRQVKAELDNGELTLVVPKSAAAQAESDQPAPGSPPPRTRRAKATGKGNGSARRTPRRGGRPGARRG